VLRAHQATIPPTGMAFLEIAHDRACGSASSSTTSSRITAASHHGPDAERFLYIFGVRGLLESLPADLTSAERQQLVDAMPFYQPDHHHHSSSSSPSSSPSSSARLSSSSSTFTFSTPQSRLHRLVRFVTAHIIIALSVLIPLVVPILRDLNRRFGVWERLTAIVRSVAHGLENGRTGDMAGDVTLWGVEGVVGGLVNGLVDGLQGLQTGGESGCWMNKGG